MQTACLHIFSWFQARRLTLAPSIPSAKFSGPISVLDQRQVRKKRLWHTSGLLFSMWMLVTNVYQKLPTSVSLCLRDWTQPHNHRGRSIVTWPGSYVTEASRCPTNAHWFEEEHLWCVATSSHRIWNNLKAGFNEVDQFCKCSQKLFELFRKSLWSQRFFRAKKAMSNFAYRHLAAWLRIKILLVFPVVETAPSLRTITQLFHCDIFHPQRNLHLRFSSRSASWDSSEKNKLSCAELPPTYFTLACLNVGRLIQLKGKDFTFYQLVT